MVVEGPIVSLQKPENAPAAEHWPTAAEQLWPNAVTDELIAAGQPAPTCPGRTTADPPPPLVGPPLYGGAPRPADRGSRPTDRPRAQPEWFRELNLDPRNRMVGGVGTRVIQAEQEDLMAEAWNQVGDVDAANRALRLAQLAKAAGRLAAPAAPGGLSEAALVAVTDGCTPRCSGPGSERLGGGGAPAPCRPP